MEVFFSNDVVLMHHTLPGCSAPVGDQLAANKNSHILKLGNNRDDPPCALSFQGAALFVGF